MANKALGIISANYDISGFGPLLKKRTLATLPFGARYRMIDFALSNLTNAGITTVGIITPHYYRSLMDHVGDGKPWDLDRNRGGLFVMPGAAYGEEVKKYRFPLKDLIRNRRILDSCAAETVVLCDTSCVLNADIDAFVKAHEESRCKVTFMYKNMVSSVGRSILDIDGNGIVKGIGESTGEAADVFLGIFAISREYLIQLLENYDAVDYLDIFDVFRLDIGKHRINTYEFKAYVGIIDTLRDYEQVSGDLISLKTTMELFESERPIRTKIQDGAPCRYRKGAVVKNSIVATGAVIEGTVENSIIFRSVYVEKGAVVKNSVIMQHGIICEGAEVENAILDKSVKVGKGKKLSGAKDNYIVVAKGTEV